MPRLPSVSVPTPTLDRGRQIAALQKALRESTRPSRWNANSPDPHATDLLSYKRAPEVLDGIAGHLAEQGIEDVRPLSGGFESVVLDAGDRVAKIGMGAPRDSELPAGVLGVLPYESTARFGPFRVELQKKVSTKRPDGSPILDEDVANLESLLGQQWWDWGDAATDNMAFSGDQPVVIDGVVTPSKGAAEWPLRRRANWPDTFYPQIAAPPTADDFHNAEAMARIWGQLSGGSLLGNLRDR